MPMLPLTIFASALCYLLYLTVTHSSSPMTDASEMRVAILTALTKEYSFTQQSLKNKNSKSSTAQNQYPGPSADQKSCLRIRTQTWVRSSGRLRDEESKRHHVAQA